MGQTLNAVTGLGEPFLSVDEQVFVVPEFRLEQARTYLISSDWSVAEIAARTGFSSASIFSRNFRRRVGVSPSRYRQDRWREAALGRVADGQPYLG